MAEVEYMHVCDYAFNAEGNKPSMIGVFDRISAGAFPTHHPYMAVAIQFRGQQHEMIPVKVELGRPNGEVLAKVESQVVAGPEGGAFLVLNMVAVQFPEPGRYTVRVSSAGLTLATHSVRVQKIQAQQAPQAPVH